MSLQNEFVKTLKWKRSLISWFACSKWYNIVRWCIWQFSRYEFWIIWTLSSSISYSTNVSMASSLKTKVNLNKLTNTDMLLMVGKSIRDGIFHAIPDIWKLITNTWKIMIKIKNHDLISITTKIIFLDWQCHKSTAQ